jgi:hypothetical protein
MEKITEDELLRTIMFFFRTEFGESKHMLLNESPIFYDTRRTIFCLSFPSTDRATAPGGYEQFYLNV